MRVHYGGWDDRALGRSTQGSRAEAEDLADVLAELFDDTGGPPTDQELSRARERLARAERR